MSGVVAATTTGYGAVELKRIARNAMSAAVLLAGLLHVLVVGGWWVSTRLRHEQPPTRTVRVMKYSELGPPPSISTANAPAAVAVALPKALVKPKVGIPVPVPDEKVAPEQTILTQEELSAVPITDLQGVGTGGTSIEQDIDVANIVEEEAPPPDFVPFEQEPQVVHRVEPAYPPAARESGVEGSVFAKLWIDKEGKVRDVVILKTPSEAFNESVIDAAQQWVFTPAVMSSGPVAVWFTVRFTFALN